MTRREQGLAALQATGIQATEEQRELALAELLEQVAFPADFPSIAAAILQRVVDRHGFFTGPEAWPAEVLDAVAKEKPKKVMVKAPEPRGLHRQRWRR